MLREVSLVSVRTVGQQRLYRLNGEGLKPVHDWAKGFEQFWNENFDRLGDYLDELQGRKPAARSKTAARTTTKRTP